MPAASEDLRCLASLPPGACGVLDLAGVPPTHRLRLAQLGLRAGARVTVLGRTAGGGRLVGSGTTRVGLDAGTSRRLALTVDGGIS